MSLIALTVDPTLGAPSVVTSSTSFNADGPAILIQNADDKQLTAGSKHCNAGYDLRVGSMFRDHRNPKWQTLGRDDSINLLPGTAVIILTEESVEFPKKRFGQIFPKVTLLDKGIANITSKVDPGFRGPLRITVFNHGKRPVPLSSPPAAPTRGAMKRGRGAVPGRPAGAVAPALFLLRRFDPFCSLNVFDVSGPVRPYINKGQDFGTGRASGFGRTVRDWIDRNVPLVTSIQTAATVAALLIAAVALTK